MSGEDADMSKENAVSWHWAIPAVLLAFMTLGGCATSIPVEDSYTRFVRVDRSAEAIRAKYATTIPRVESSDQPRPGADRRRVIHAKY